MDAERAPTRQELFAAAAPLLDDAVKAAVAKNGHGVDAALGRLFALGMQETFYAYGLLGSLAALGLKAPPDAIGFMPVVVRDGRAADPDAPENAALAFVGRFVGAAHAKDEGQAKALWLALMEPCVGADPVPGARETFGAAWRLLVVAAIEGRRREKRREQRTHQHPAARHNGHRRHPRGQRKH